MTPQPAPQLRGAQGLGFPPSPPLHHCPTARQGGQPFCSRKENNQSPNHTISAHHTCSHAAESPTSGQPSPGGLGHSGDTNPSSLAAPLQRQQRPYRQLLPVRKLLEKTPSSVQPLASVFPPPPASSRETLPSPKVTPACVWLSCR